MGQFAELSYLLPSCPPAAVQAYREEAASLQAEIASPYPKACPPDFVILLSLLSFSEI